MGYKINSRFYISKDTEQKLTKAEKNLISDIDDKNVSRRGIIEKYIKKNLRTAFYGVLAFTDKKSLSTDDVIEKAKDILADVIKNSDLISISDADFTNFLIETVREKIESTISLHPDEVFYIEETDEAENIVDNSIETDLKPSLIQLLFDEYTDSKDLEKLEIFFLKNNIYHESLDKYYKEHDSDEFSNTELCEIFNKKSYQIVNILEEIKTILLKIVEAEETRSNKTKEKIREVYTYQDTIEDIRKILMDIVSTKIDDHDESEKKDEIKKFNLKILKLLEIVSKHNTIQPFNLEDKITSNDSKKGIRIITIKKSVMVNFRQQIGPINDTLEKTTKRSLIEILLFRELPKHKEPVQNTVPVTRITRINQYILENNWKRDSIEQYLEELNDILPFLKKEQEKCDKHGYYLHNIWDRYVKTLTVETNTTFKEIFAEIDNIDKFQEKTIHLINFLKFLLEKIPAIDKSYQPDMIEVEVVEIYPGKPEL